MTTDLASSTPLPPLTDSAPPPPLTTQHSPLSTSPSFPFLPTWTLLSALAALAASALTLALHGHRGFFVSTLALTLTLAAALFDAWTTRIPNALTYPAILLGLVLNALSTLIPQSSTLHTWLAAPGLQQSLLGFAVCAALGLVGFALAQVGGGDIKLLAALGALLGLADIGQVMVLALFIALVYALLNLALLGRLNTLARLSAQRTLELLYFRRLATAFEDPEKPSAKNIPMALPLALALLLTQLLDLSPLLGGAR